VVDAASLLLHCRYCAVWLLVPFPLVVLPAPLLVLPAPLVVLPAPLVALVLLALVLPSMLLTLSDNQVAVDQSGYMDDSEFIEFMLEKTHELRDTAFGALVASAAAEKPAAELSMAEGEKVAIIFLNRKA